MIEHTDLEPVSCVYLFQLFPFAIAFDRTMTIRQVGEKSRELFGGEEMVGLPVETFFLMHRPRVSFTWDSVSAIDIFVFLTLFHENWPVPLPVFSKFSFSLKIL